MRKVLIIISIFMILIGVGAVVSVIPNLDLNTPTEETVTTEDESKCYITLEEFNKLNNGMSYEQVKKIVGCDGTLNSDTAIGNVSMKTFSWYGKDEISNANTTFENNKMVNKTQIGLK